MTFTKKEQLMMAIPVFIGIMSVVVYDIFKVVLTTKMDYLPEPTKTIATYFVAGLLAVAFGSYALILLLKI